MMYHARIIIRVEMMHCTKLTLGPKVTYRAKMTHQAKRRHAILNRYPYANIFEILQTTAQGLKRDRKRFIRCNIKRR